MRLVRSVELSGALRAWGGMRDQSRNLDHCLRYFHSAIHAAVDRNLVRLVFLGLGMLEGVGWRMTWNSTFKTPGQPLKRSAMKRSSRRKHKIEGHHDSKMLAACRGESCYLIVPGVCPRIPQDETVVDCHGNWADTGKGLGLKAADRYSVPGCAACHYWLDFGTTATREVKRITFFDALARWQPVRDGVMA